MRWVLYSMLGIAAGCGWPATRMEPAGDYASTERPTISSAPARTAGPSYVRTYSPDGATRFVCADGTTRNAARVEPGAAPAC